MALVVGGWTDYIIETPNVQRYLEGGGDADSVLDISPDLFDSWGVGHDDLPGAGQAVNGRLDGVPGPNGHWFQLVNLGLTNGEYSGLKIWFRTYWIFTSDQNDPNAARIVGGRQLFWHGGQTAEQYRWGEITTDNPSGAGQPPNWMGIGVSGWLQAESPAGSNIVAAQNLDYGEYDYPGSDDPAFPQLTGPDYSGPTLWSVANYDPWGLCVSQIRVYAKPATAAAPIGLVGWDERVTDHPLVVTNGWGQSADSNIMGVGQWISPEFGWGPSILRLFTVPSS